MKTSVLKMVVMKLLVATITLFLVTTEMLVLRIAVIPNLDAVTILLNVMTMMLAQKTLATITTVANLP
jgi:hypothetical protein